MSKKRIVFLGSKAIGAFCLKHLLDKRGQYNIEIVTVATKQNAVLDKGVTVSSLCAQHGLELVKGVEDIPQCDIIISVQHHEILSQHNIDKAELLAVNLHMAPLPEYRGCNQFSFAILDGKEEFGTTLHKMTPGIDDGDIIAERRFKIANDIWVEDLYNITVQESEQLFMENIESLVSGDFETKSQQSLIEKRGSSYHFRKEINAIKQLDESWSLEKKKRHVRATYMSGFEPPYSWVDGNKKYYDKSSF